MPFTTEIECLRPEDDPTSLGHVARIFRGLSLTDLKDALVHHTRQGELLGECLVALGKLSRADLTWLLEKQRSLREAPTNEDVCRVLDYTVALTEELLKQTVP